MFTGMRQLAMLIAGAALACVAAPGMVVLAWLVAGRLGGSSDQS